ncbi:MAG: HAD-IA family hydrolase [Clostridia bacterium]|nr:HAD-IA family hydrolase [Clostridia bacterium]
MSNIKAVVFDLDGTLLNTLTDLAASSNRALAQMGRPTRTVDEVKSFIGNGARLLCNRLVGLDAPEETVNECLRLFQADYNIHLNDNTAPYPGIMNMLETLRDNGVACAVVSNKYDAATRAICKLYFGDLIPVTIGEGNGISKKPCPDGTNKALELMGVSAEEALYVGDSDTDVETAHNANLFCVGVTWGFRSRQVLEMAGAESIIDRPDELLDIILQ